MPITVIIPARLESSRFPRKLLADLQGKPVIQHTVERIQHMKQDKKIIIATDALEIQELAKMWNVSCLLTSSSCCNGTERIAELLPQLAGNFFMNVQADEILINSTLLDVLANTLLSTACDLITPIFEIQKIQDLISPHLIKTILNSQGHAIYFSRTPIPYIQNVVMDEWMNRHIFWGHIGVYGYSRRALEAYKKETPSSLEIAESLEQLRFLNTQFYFNTLLTDHVKIAINTPEDLKLAHKYLQENNLPST
jgi:3-deoxy-manno-octulosonate cytidylyltransferase (CMP-KDO synthetase)